MSKWSQHPNGHVQKGMTKPWGLPPLRLSFGTHHPVREFGVSSSSSVLLALLSPLLLKLGLKPARN